VICLQVLVEFDDHDWEQREWIHIYNIFQVFLVENTLVSAPREDPQACTEQTYWPAIVSHISYPSPSSLPKAGKCT